jgi:hypothetical protein
VLFRPHAPGARTQLQDAARYLIGANVLAARLYGVGAVTALTLTCWLPGEGWLLPLGPGSPRLVTPRRKAPTQAADHTHVHHGSRFGRTAATVRVADGEP